MKHIHNIGSINTLNAINRLINNLGLKHLKAQILTQLIKFRVHILQQLTKLEFQIL
jgi:hypothetical protein